jgi:NAD-dependent SIR2 family protein deacetylase
MTTEPKCECAFCKNDLPFTLPPEIVDACCKRDLVVFAGAGISTENDVVFPSTLYEDIVEALGLDPAEELEFEDVMGQFCDTHGKAELLKRIKQRFDYIDAFPELRRSATRFHKELGTIPCIDTIITTNWDPYFELITGAFPMVSDQDYAFWDLPNRRVFKIHGSMATPSSIVATTRDYRTHYAHLKTAALGGSLRHILATKTVVFIGYSLRDSDFKKIYGFLRRNMQDVLPRSYVVTTSGTLATLASNSSIIHTDGTFFLKTLKDSLVDAGVMSPDTLYEGIPNLLGDVLDAHEKVVDSFPLQKYPETVFTISYQDGLIHAFERIMARRFWGEYSDPPHVGRLLHSYEHLLKGAIRGKRYFDAAYIEGYINGIIAYADPDGRRWLPRYFLFGAKEELRTLTQFRRAVRHAPDLHKSASKAAARITRGFEPGFVPLHTPFLNGVIPA